MGNESSKAAVERTNEILADFTADERAMLDQIFNEWLSEEMKDQWQGAKGKDIVSGGSVKVSNSTREKDENCLVLLDQKCG